MVTTHTGQLIIPCRLLKAVTLGRADCQVSRFMPSYAPTAVRVSAAMSSPLGMHFIYNIRLLYLDPSKCTNINSSRDAAPCLTRLLREAVQLDAATRPSPHAPKIELLVHQRLTHVRRITSRAIISRRRRSNFAAEVGPHSHSRFGRPRNKLPVGCTGSK